MSSDTTWAKRFIDDLKVFRKELRITPANGGSYLLQARSSPGDFGESWCFSSVSDLMSWLHARAKEVQSEPHPMDASGSGGRLMTDHVICPACAHNFSAISDADRDRINELEAEIGALRSKGGEDFGPNSIT